MTDPVSDLLARIRNAGQARHAELVVPVLEAEAGGRQGARRRTASSTPSASRRRTARPCCASGCATATDGRFLIDGMRRVSKPSRRGYVDVRHIPHVRRGLGIAVLSTPNGVLSDREAREQNVGGELVCEVW